MSTVRIYDMKTGRSREIPARELAPGYVKVTFAEDGEEAFVLAADLKPQPSYQHPPFTGPLKLLMQDFATVFADVFPKTAAQWEDDFRRDLDYMKEVEFWAGVAGAFRHFTSGKSWSREERRDVFNILFSCLTNGLQAGLECVELKALSRAQALEIRERMESEAATSGAARIPTPDPTMPAVNVTPAVPPPLPGMDEEAFARFVRERTDGNQVSRDDLRELREEYDEQRRDAR